MVLENDQNSCRPVELQLHKEKHSTLQITERFDGRRWPHILGMPFDLLVAGFPFGMVCERAGTIWSS